MNLKPKPGFDLGHVAWGAPNAPPALLCSYCSGPLPEVPFMICKPSGHVARFCDDCSHKWWGLTIC